MRSGELMIAINKLIKKIINAFNKGKRLGMRKAYEKKD